MDLTINDENDCHTRPKHIDIILNQKLKYREYTEVIVFVVWIPFEISGRLQNFMLLFMQGMIMLCELHFLIDHSLQLSSVQYKDLYFAR